jgi:hypothetical protein
MNTFLKKHRKSFKIANNSYELKCKWCGINSEYWLCCEEHKKLLVDEKKTEIKHMIKDIFYKKRKFSGLMLSCKVSHKKFREINKRFLKGFRIIIKMLNRSDKRGFKYG